MTRKQGNMYTDSLSIVFFLLCYCSFTSQQFVSSTETFAVWNNCAKYSYYNNSELLTFSCGYDLKWNEFRGCCVNDSETFTSECEDDPNKPTNNNRSCLVTGVKQEHPNKCDSYFECIDSTDSNGNSIKVIVEKSCKTDQFFDWQTKSCVDLWYATPAPNCTTTSMNKCVTSSKWRKSVCSLWKYLPSAKTYETLNRICMVSVCTATWFI